MARNYRNWIVLALEFLFGHNDPVVQQKDVVSWLRSKNKKITEAGLSTFKRDVEQGVKIGVRRLKSFADLLEFYINEHLQYDFNADSGTFTARPGTSGIQATSKPAFAFNAFFQERLESIPYHPGRLLLSQKAKLVENAAHEIVEVGVRLKTFASYFNEHSDKAYKDYFINALRRGVNITCILLDPEAKITRNYFEDRSRFDVREERSIEDIGEVIKQLKALRAQLLADDFSGMLDLYSYAHFPQNHFFCVDKDSPNGVIVVSAYLQGMKRAKCPVLIVSRQVHPTLFNIYNESVNYILSNIKKID